MARRVKFRSRDVVPPWLVQKRMSLGQRICMTESSKGLVNYSLNGKKVEQSVFLSLLDRGLLKRIYINERESWFMLK